MTAPADSRPPIIGITCDVHEPQVQVRRAYIEAVRRAGGIPILLPPPQDQTDLAAVVEAHLTCCHGIVFTGGNDPDLTRFGLPNHPASKLMHPDRQRYEEALFAALDHKRQMPVLGICLGMQQMSLHAGGKLNPHLPDDTASAQDHLQDNHHEVLPVIPHPVITKGRGASSHHQGIRDPGRLRHVASAPDGLIESVDDPSRPFYLGVQWHPERTSDPNLGDRIFKALIAAATHAAKPAVD